MIKINLCPKVELENPYWWVGDAAIVVILAFSGIYALQQYEASIQEKIDDANKRRESYETSLAELKPDLDRAEELKNDNKKLNELLVALQSITTSKIEKFKPVIVLEHLQSLKPEGVWYKSINFEENNRITLEGQAFDNILVAEFAMALRATQNQESDASDLRTQVQFGELKLKEILTTGSVELNPLPSAGVPAMTGYPTFNLSLNVVEKAAAAPAETIPVSALGSPGLSGSRVARGK
jgi:Tfp pilus assembly protein PilN